VDSTRLATYEVIALERAVHRVMYAS